MKASCRRVRVTDRGGLPKRIADSIREELRMYAGREIVIKIGRVPRSISANRYYWGVVISSIREALLDTGQAFTAEQLHALFKERYLDPTATDNDTRPPTTTKLDTFEFFHYVERIRHDEEVLALGVEIPEPLDVEGSDIHEINRR